MTDIAGVKVDGSIVSVTDGKFNLWIDAEDTFPKTYVISATGYADTTITITLNA